MLAPDAELEDLDSYLEKKNIDTFLEQQSSIISEKLQAYDATQMAIKRGHSEEQLRTELRDKRKDRLRNQIREQLQVGNTNMANQIPHEIEEVSQSKESSKQNSKQSTTQTDNRRNYLQNNRGKTSLDPLNPAINMEKVANRIEFGTIEAYNRDLDTNEFLEKMQRNIEKNEGAEIGRNDIDSQEIEGVNRTASRILTDKLNLYMTEQSFGRGDIELANHKKNMFYNIQGGDSQFTADDPSRSKLSPLVINQSAQRNKHIRETFGNAGKNSRASPTNFEEELRKNERELNDQLQKYKEMMELEEERKRSVSRSRQKDRSLSKSDKKEKSGVRESGGSKGRVSKKKNKKHRYKHHSEMESVLHDGNQMGEILMDNRGMIRKTTSGERETEKASPIKNNKTKLAPVKLEKNEEQKEIEEKAESVKSDLFEENEKETLPKDMLISNKLETIKNEDLQEKSGKNHSDTTRIVSESNQTSEKLKENKNYTSIQKKGGNTENKSNKESKSEIGSSAKKDIIDNTAENPDSSRKSSKKGVEITLEFDKSKNLEKKRENMMKRLDKNRKRMMKSKSKKKFTGSPGFKQGKNYMTDKNRNLTRNASRSFSKTPKRAKNISVNSRNKKTPKRVMSRNASRTNMSRNNSRSLSRNLSKKNFMSSKVRGSNKNSKSRNFGKNHKSVNNRLKKSFKTHGSKKTNGSKETLDKQSRTSKTKTSRRFEDDNEIRQDSGVNWSEAKKELAEDDSHFQGKQKSGFVHIESEMKTELNPELIDTFEFHKITKEEYQNRKNQAEESNLENQTLEDYSNENDQSPTRETPERLSNRRSDEDLIPPMEWIEERESFEGEDLNAPTQKRFQTVDNHIETQKDSIRPANKISEGSNIRNKFELSRARFKEKKEVGNDFDPDRAEKQINEKKNRSGKKLHGVSKSPVRGKSPGGRKIRLPKYLSQKNSKFNRNTNKHMRGPNNYLKMNYIIKNVLLVGGWNAKRRKAYLEMVKANKKCHMLVVFKNKNGHDCLGMYSYLFHFF